MTAQVLNRTVGPLHTIKLTISDLSAFREWRVEVRNRVDYLRRINPLWHKFGFGGGFIATAQFGASSPPALLGRVRWPNV